MIVGEFARRLRVSRGRLRRYLTDGSRKVA